MSRAASWRANHVSTRAFVRKCEDRLVAARALPGRRDYRKFVVVARARTGSNLLRSLLNSHPQIDTKAEVFRKLSGATPASRLAEVYRRKPRRIVAVGFTIFYYQPLDGEGSGVWDLLGALDDLYVVHLRRRNVLRTLTSRKVAGLTNVWRERSDSSAVIEKPTVRFSAQELEDAFEQNEIWADSCTARFGTHPLLEIAYEDLLSDASALERVCRFLGAPPRAMSTTLRRQNPEDLAALITNFDELRAHFRGSRWAAFFDDA